MKFWSSPFPIDKQTEVFLNQFKIRYKEFNEINYKDDCILIYDTPDNIFNNLINEHNSNNQFRKNINGYIKIKEIIENKNLKAFAAWHVKSLSNNDIKKLIIEDSFEESSPNNHDLIPKSINPIISIITLGFININPNFLESYIELELSNNLYGRKFDGETIERLNLDLNINKLDALFDAIDNINNDKINLTHLKQEFEILKTENNTKDLKIKEYLNLINKLESSLNKKDQLIKENQKKFNQLNLDLENKNNALDNYSNKNYVLNDELKLDKLQISFLQKEIEKNIVAATSNSEIIDEYTIQLERSKRLLNQLYVDLNGGNISEIRNIDYLTKYSPKYNKLKFFTSLKNIFRNRFIKNR